MRIGFTGTRRGMTHYQERRFSSWVAASGVTLFRHGCCHGADEQAALIVNQLPQKPTIFGHPSDLNELTSKNALAVCDDTAQPEPPLSRNRDIVNGSDVIVACPRLRIEEHRSGTWATIRYARKIDKPLVIFWPDGTVTEEAADASA